MEGFRMPSSGPNPHAVKSPRRAGRFVSLLPDVQGIRCPWDVVIDTALDQEKRRQVAHGATVGVIRRGSQAGSLLAVHGARAIQPNGLEMVRVMSSHVGMPNYIGVLHVPGGVDQRRAIWFESFNEMHHLMDLVLVGRAVDVVTQPVRFEWRFPRRGLREHTPDALVALRDGRLLLVDVTRAEKLRTDPRLGAILTLTAETCRAIGWEYQVRTELPAQRCRNLRFLWGDFGRETVPDETVRMTGQSAGRVRVADIEAALACPDARRRVLAAMASGQLFVDLDQPLAPWSPVYGTPPREAPPWLIQV